MKVIKYICDKCNREIEGRFFGIMPELLDPKNPEVLSDDYLDDPVSAEQSGRHYCRACVEKIIRYANSVPARENPEFKKAVDEMVQSAKAQKPAKKNKLSEREVRSMIDAGRTVKEIAEHFGVTYNAVYGYIKRHGLTRQDEPVECTEKVMATCAYAGKAGNTVICDYLGITGKVRNCTSRACTEYKPVR